MTHSRMSGEDDNESTVAARPCHDRSALAMTLPRDLIGYGKNLPHAAWPGGARIAINFVLNYEEGSEYSIGDGDGFSETALSEGASQVPHGTRDLTVESVYEFGSRVGFWRVMRLFAERRLPLTIFGCALALERNPLAADAIRTAGFDVCSHGWRWIKHYQLTRTQERQHIAKAIASFQKTIGERPLGWYCRYGPSVNTRALLVEEGGFLYDSDAYNDELPYWRTVNGRGHLVVPYSLTTNDGKYVGWTGTADQWFAFVRDAFDLLLREGARHPKMMSVGLHMRMIGHPARAAGLERLLDYVAKQDGVWITRRLDIARHWIATHPYPGHGLNEIPSARPAATRKR